MQSTVGARGNARVVALTILVLCTGRGAFAASALKVSVAGRAIDANARTEGKTVVGDVVAVLRGLGAKVAYSDGALKGATFDGEAVQAEVGGTTIAVGGRVQRLTTPLRSESGRLLGPIADVATAVGCRVWFAKAAGELRIAARLAQVEAHAAEEGALVHITVTGPAQAQLERLDDPPRAYADLVGLTWTGQSESIQVGGTGGLNRIRWALFQEWPPVARVVVDLAPGAQVRMLQAEDGLFVITTRPADSSPVTTPASVATAKASLESVHIVLDPAAGGDDAGVRGANVTEKAVTLDIAARAAVALMNARALVTLTRDGDRTVSAQERAELIRSLAPDVVVRIACAASADPAQQGIETRYRAARAAALGATLQSALVRKTGARDRGAAQSEEGPLGAAAAVACVVGYVSSPGESRLLATPEYREKIAQGIAEGIASSIARNTAAHGTAP